MGCGLEHEACVLSEPFDVAFVPGVDEDRGVVPWPSPMLPVDQVLLLEGLVALGVEVEVVEDLGEVLGLVATVPVPGTEDLLRADDGGRETRDVLGGGEGAEP